MIPFKAISFGYASAEKEGVEAPQLLIDGFLDLAGITHEVLDGSRFLILGYKGSGKSAVGNRLRILAETDPELFVEATDLGSFPYADLGNVIPGNHSTDAKYPIVWSWLLLPLLIDSFRRDQGAALANPEFARAVRALEALQTLPPSSLDKQVVESSKASFKAKVASVLEATYERNYKGQDLHFTFLIDRLLESVLQFKSDSRHLLVIDGLDDILLHDEVQYRALAALVVQVDKLNSRFRQAGVPAKIILLCRTDLFERLPSANKNKIRQDSSIRLDWYHDTRKPAKSNLIRLANLRAKLADPSISDVFDDYFPRAVFRDRSQTRTVLLDHTRHTPRDFIMLLTWLQHHSMSTRVGEDEILSGLRSYSVEYFLPELRDELEGYVEPEVGDSAFELIGSLRTRDFSFQQLREKAAKNPKFANVDLEKLLQVLFECSAVGNVVRQSDGETYYYFRYRNRSSSLDLSERLLLHRGVWRALNLA